MFIEPPALADIPECMQHLRANYSHWQDLEEREMASATPVPEEDEDIQVIHLDSIAKDEG